MRNVVTRFGPRERLDFKKTDLKEQTITKMMTFADTNRVLTKLGRQVEEGKMTKVSLMMCWDTGWEVNIKVVLMRLSVQGSRSMSRGWRK